MSDIAIAVDRVSKRYRLGRGPQGRGDFRDAVGGLVRRMARRWRGGGAPAADDRDLWALHDVSFEVRKGEVVGLIGHNGAGKSTLLRILSRITDPTEGEAWFEGRLGSLLEVGTGFHPELSGRENIFLSGAILGMSRREIQQKFDEIVEFSECGRFLDTPVKRYSSGMYVRLGFAVAAHLDPEILIVDEVLAVGDAAFQRKCLEKMTAVAEEGRTILFVSHNMASVQSLCHRAIVLSDGRVAGMGEPADVVRSYLSSVTRQSGTALADRTDRRGRGRTRMVRATICSDIRICSARCRRRSARTSGASCRPSPLRRCVPCPSPSGWRDCWPTCDAPAAHRSCRRRRTLPCATHSTAAPPSSCRAGRRGTTACSPGSRCSSDGCSWRQHATTALVQVRYAALRASHVNDYEPMLRQLTSHRGPAPAELAS